MLNVFSDLFNSLSFVMDFNDPATLYIESLIGVHNNVMWYLVLILTVVYWTLYNIINDSSWTSFNSQVGFLSIFFSNSILLNLYSFAILLYVEVYSFVLNLFFNTVADVSYIVSGLNTGEAANDMSAFASFFFTNFDQAIFNEGVSAPYWANPTTSNNTIAFFREIWTQNYLDNLLFGATNAAYFYYGRTAGFDSALTSKYSSFLTVQQFNHSTLLEVIWATFPSVIILLILVPSILLIYSVDEDLDPEFTINVVGHQWFWSYEFDGWLPVSALNENFPAIPSLVEFSLADPALYSTFEFDSCMVITDSLELGQRRLLEVDNPLVVPCSVGLSFLITSADVLHAWALPQLGINVDAVPGRLSQYISMIRSPGIFYGQCSEICGVAHAFMPIVVHGAPYAFVLPVWTDFVETPNFNYPEELKSSQNS